MVHRKKHRAVIYRNSMGSGNAVVKAPAPLKPGHERCPVCRAGAAITSRGYLRGHRDLFGHRCYNRERPHG